MKSTIFISILLLMIVLDSCNSCIGKQESIDEILTNSFVSDTFICYQSILPTIDSVKHITYLDLYAPSIGNLPKEIEQLTNLKVFFIAKNGAMTELPKELGKLKKLEEIRITKALRLETIPDEICELVNLKVLQIAWGGLLTEIPDSIGKLKNLEMLLLGTNRLTKLPESVTNLKKLKVIDIWNNQIPKAEYERLKELMPNTDIYYDSPYGY
jgi:Leucine-rich repeat (LRR) protein